MQVNIRVGRQTRKHAASTPSTDEAVKAAIKAAAREARQRYNPDRDPLLNDFKKKMREIRMSS